MRFDVQKTLLLSAALASTLALGACMDATGEGEVTRARSGIISAEFMSSKAKTKGRFCSVQWDSWLGPKSAVRSYPTVQISGTDLAAYRSNTDPVINLLHSLNVAVARGGSPEKLKSFLLNMASNRHFTELSPYRPETWHGKVPSWMSSYNRLAEPAYAAAHLLIPAAQSYALLEPHMTTSETKLLRSWGSAVVKTSKNARDGSREGAFDRRAAKAAGFVSWGAASGDNSAYRSGVTLFRGVIGSIRADGSDSYFTVSGHEGQELKYLNMTYGFLSIAAAVMESRGEAAFGYSRGNGGSLADGLDFLITQSFEPSRRTKISRKQNEVRFASRPRHVTDASWAFMEFAAMSPTVRKDVSGWKRALNVRGGVGFYGGHHGGYTSCLFGN